MNKYLSVLLLVLFKVERIRKEKKKKIPVDLRRLSRRAGPEQKQKQAREEEEKIRSVPFRRQEGGRNEYIYPCFLYFTQWPAYYLLSPTCPRAPVPIIRSSL